MLICLLDCYVKGQSNEYRGNIKNTVDGIKCLDWNDFLGYIKYIRYVNFPEYSVNSAANFCRDPNKSGRPWCFVADHHWDYCNITVCSMYQHLIIFI